MNLKQALQVAIQLHQQGNLTKAKELYQQILQIDREQPIALHLLGVVAFQAGRYDIAEELISRAINIKSNFDEAHNNLANVMKSVGRMQEAVNHYKKAINIKPGVADCHYNLATAYESLNQFENAVEHFLRAIELNPANSVACFSLANTFRREGQLDNSIKFYRKVISINPEYAEAYRQIASISKFSTHDDDIKIMQQLIVKPSLTDSQKMHLGFGLGKAFEDIKDYQQSFQYIEKANLIKRKEFVFDIANWDRYIEKQMNVFNAEFFEKYSTSGCLDDAPIFILGMPRSGTSLVEQILASHSQVFAAGEVQVLGSAVYSVFDVASFPENILQAEDQAFKELGEKYLKVMRNTAGLASFFSDKMPDNFKMIGMIKLMLPNAKIIHCQRNPVDNCLSIFKNYFSSNDLIYAYDQQELAKYYNGYAKLMKHWHRVLPGFIYDIHYEELVDEQQQQTRALLKFCGLEWQDTCLEFYQTKRAVKTASAAQVRQPVYRDSVQLWKHYEKQLQPLLQSLDNIE